MHSYFQNVVSSYSSIRTNDETVYFSEYLTKFFKFVKTLPEMLIRSFPILYVWCAGLYIKGVLPGDATI